MFNPKCVGIAHGPSKDFSLGLASQKDYICIYIYIHTESHWLRRYMLWVTIAWVHVLQQRLRMEHINYKHQDTHLVFSR